MPMVSKLPISSAAVLCQPRLIVCFRTRLSVRIEGKDFPVRVRAELLAQWGRDIWLTFHFLRLPSCTPSIWRVYNDSSPLSVACSVGRGAGAEGSVEVRNHTHTHTHTHITSHHIT